MSDNLTPQQTLIKVAEYFASESAVDSCLGEIGNARFLAERNGDTVTLKIFEQVEGVNGYELTKTLEAALSPSTGSLGVIAGLEYFTRENGDLYRAQVSNFVGSDGYRVGARWQAAARMAQSQFEMIRAA